MQANARIPHEKLKKDYIEILKFCECIKFGHFTFKSGKTSNVYCDLRSLPSYPIQFKFIVQGIGYQLRLNKSLKKCDLVCGVPHGAVPLATAIAYEFGRPLIWCRKEAKEHGLKKMIEGQFKKGQKVLVVEDVTTTGGSVLECIEILEQEGLEVEMVYVIMDRREEGSGGNIGDKYPMTSLLDLDDLKDQYANLEQN